VKFNRALATIVPYDATRLRKRCRPKSPSDLEGATKPASSIAIDVKVGDRVLFGKWSGTEVKIDGVEYLIMKESDIMGVLTEAEASKKAA